MVQFANRMNQLKGSEIRELLKLTARPDIISFAGGLPAPELFPVEEMKTAAAAVMDEAGRQALQYSTTEGFPRLREQIAQRMFEKNNIKTDPNHILTDQLLIPGIGFGIGEVDHRRREGGDGHQVILAGFVFHAISLLRYQALSSAHFLSSEVFCTKLYLVY